MVDSQQVLQTGRKGFPISGVCIGIVAITLLLRNGFVSILVGLGSGASKPY